MVSLSQLKSALPPYAGDVVVIKKEQTTKTIVNEILTAHTLFSRQYDLICEYFNYETPEDVAHVLFDFLKKNIPYIVEDEDFQSSRSPAGILELAGEAGTDCKHYALFCGGVIDALNRNFDCGYTWFYRFASYDRIKSPGHVFVVLIDDSGKEIWIDPVLKKLNQRSPYPRYKLDKNPSMLVRMSGVGRHKMGAASQINVSEVQTGATGQQKIVEVGSAITAVGAALAEIPVAAAIVAAVGGLVTLAGKLFGSTWKYNNEIRWLIQMYEYYVLGNASVKTDNDADESLLEEAWQWYYAVLGVPLYDRNTLAILANKAASNGTDQNYSYPERAARYLSYPEIAKLAYDVTEAEAETAAHLADQFVFWLDPGTYKKPAPPGAWAKIPLAQYWITLAESQAAAQAAQSIVPTAVAEASNPSTTTASSGSGILNWIETYLVPTAIIVLLIGVGIYELSQPSKNKKHG